MLRLAFTLAFFVGHADPAPSGSPDPQSLLVPAEELSRARELVQQLGNEQFAERERAEEELAKMGRLARPVLVEAANTDPNQEVRTRCSALLPKATALDLQARLEVFLADTEGKYEHDLPGWGQFLATVRGSWSLFGYDIPGDRSLDKAARGVFADLIASPPNRRLLLAADESETELGAVVTARRLELYYQRFPRNIIMNGRLVQTTRTRRDPTIEDIATLLFTESLVPSRAFGRNAPISNLISASPFSHTVNTTGEKARVYRALAAAWIDSRQDPVDMYQCMSLASTLGLGEHGCRIGIRLLTTPGVLGAYRGMAAVNLARLGKKEHIPLLDRALTDTAVAYTIRRGVPGKANEPETHDVQVRDMALAVGVILSGQKLEDYGFRDAYGANRGIANTTYHYSRYFIPDDERKAVFQKWKEWRAKNP